MINFDVGGHHRQKLRERNGRKILCRCHRDANKRGHLGAFLSKLILLNLMYDKFDTAATAAA